jgi:hypothetical protein
MTGMSNGHERRYARLSDVRRVPETTALVQALMLRTIEAACPLLGALPCRLWTGAMASTTPVVHHRKKIIDVRRLLYEYTFGFPADADPKRLFVYLVCEIDRCVSVHHMYLARPGSYERRTSEIGLPHQKRSLF